MKINTHQAQLITSNKSRNLLHLGQGGGKTNTMGHLAYQLLTYFPHVIGLVAANTYGQLSNSTLVEIFRVLTGYGIYEYNPQTSKGGSFVIGIEPPSHFKPHNYTFPSNHNKIYFANGAVWIIASLDNYKAIEGQTVGYALLDETADTKEEAVKTVITGRLRQDGIYLNPNYNMKEAVKTPNWLPFTSVKNENKINPLYIFTKPSKEPWLINFFKLNEFEEEIRSYIGNKKDYFYKKFENKCVIVGSTYLNIENVGKAYIEDRLAELTDDMAELLIWGSPFGKTGGEYYANFKKTVNVRDAIEIDQSKPLHISFDFNSKPYMSLLIAQLIDNQFNIIDEYALSAPRNTIEDICSDFISDYGHLCSSGLFVYGDATGKNESVIKSNKNLYVTVMRELAPLFPELRLLRQNPRNRNLSNGTLGRRAFVNTLLKGTYSTQVVVHERCQKLLEDFQFVKEDANGGKMKNKITVDGVSYERWGHLSDAFDYMTCWLFGEFSRDPKQ
jgi:hypothetical protein